MSETFNFKTRAPLDCRCEGHPSKDGSVDIDYCPLHRAAPELLRLLRLIVAEFKSDPMSVQCFDLGVIVDPAIALVDELESGQEPLF